MSGFEDMPLSLLSSDVVDGEKVEIDGTIETRAVQRKGGGTYSKYVIPVRKADGSKWELWVFESEARKIKREKGGKLKEYVGAVLTLGVEQALDDDGNEIKTKEGKLVQNIVIKSVE